MSEPAALAIFEKPRSLLGQNWSETTAQMYRRIEQFSALVEQGHVVRVPSEKLVR